MRIEIPQIFWHGNRDRIMSIDFYPNTNLLITSGAESENKMFVKLWRIEEVTIDTSIQGNAPIPVYGIGPQSPFEDNPNSGNNATNNQNNNNLQTLTDPENTSNVRIKPVFECELNGAHISTVNICRFSPNGKYLATGSDDNTVIIWVQKSRPTTFGSSEEKVSWSNYKILRGHSGDVYDLSWNPESKYLISGSVDNYCMIWNIEKAKCVNRFMDHEHFVQGVSWDPRNKYILTQSSDKSVRFYKNTQSKLEMKFIYINQLKRFEIKNTNNKNNTNINNNANNNKVEEINKVDNNISNNENEINKQQPQPEQKDNKDNQNINNNDNEKMAVEEEKNNNQNNNTSNSNENTNPNQNNGTNNQVKKEKEKEKDPNQKNIVTYHYYFADEDQCNTFVRRSSFSPDGKICLLVSGVMQNPLKKDELNFVVWGVSRKDFSRPQFYIPTLNKSSTCVRFCPLIFHKKENDPDNTAPALLDLNYVMIFAIGTNDSVFIYGTDSIQPRYAITNIHYQSITDLAWNGDKMLAISSSDGYISFVVFEENELGIPYKPEDINWDDEKFKKQYQLYFDVDIKKNVMSTQNIITDIKIKKKKNINNNATNNNNEGNNNIIQEKDNNDNDNEAKNVKDIKIEEENQTNNEKNNEENKNETNDIQQEKIIEENTEKIKEEKMEVDNP